MDCGVLRLCTSGMLLLSMLLLLFLMLLGVMLLVVVNLLTCSLEVTLPFAFALPLILLILLPPLLIIILLPAATTLALLTPALPLRLICRRGLTNRSSLGFLGMVHGDEADRVVVLVVGTAILYSCVVRINLDDFVG